VAAPGWHVCYLPLPARAAAANVIDLLYRMLYRMAYRLMRVYWAVFHPRTHGALVALWHGGEVLLVQNSYTPYHSMPGGYVRPRETGREAARRELEEEVGIQVELSELQPVLDVQSRWEGKRDRVEIFELGLSRRPAFQVDNREVVEARFYAPVRALELNLFPPVRTAIQRRIGGVP
jgi:ADP-ribose pyrophosphatase YjhB (NUDIX family)